MSRSSFKIIANDEPINRNLVIIVNKNGEIGTDTAALQNLLTSKETPQTEVTVIRESSPTPSISDEIDEERIQQRDFLKQQYVSEHPNASEEEIEQELKKLSELNDIPHVTLNVENFYTSDQARKFANDVLHLGGIDNPQTLMPIDFNFRRQIVQNDHCYTPHTTPPNASDKVQKNLKVKNKESIKGKKETKQRVKVRQSGDESSDSVEIPHEDDEEYEEEQSAEEEEISFSESDDDNDMDFSVNDRFGKKGKKKRKYRRHKQKNMTFKDFLEGSADLSSMDEEPKRKYGKIPKKAVASSLSRPSTSGKSIGPSTSKNTQQIITKKIQQQSNAKNSLVRKETPAQFIPLSNFKNSTTATSIGHISIQSAAPAKSSQEIEFVESIVKDLEKSFPESIECKKEQLISQSNTNTIPNIMQMMETNTPTEMIDQSLSTLEQMDASDGNVGIEEIGDALIAVLGNEAIDELLNQGDLMNFETTAAMKPSQNITSSSTIMQIPLISDVSTTTTTIAVTSPIMSAQLPKILNKQASSKDPIKVVRNGRVITLPPIEAPTTRGAKRRAQGDSTSPVGKIVKTEQKTPSTKDPDSRNSSRRSSLNKSESGRNSRRQSTAQVGNDEDDLNSDASWNSEDDPDRLWCVCKQPHNNRFMICCDKCEEWFHGTCVNVTKSMGKEIEKQAKKWHCPNCRTNAGGSVVIKKDSNKKTLTQQKLTKFFNKHQKESTDEDIPKTLNTMCVMCHQKPARTDSIYCSEDCIRNHASKHLDDNIQQLHKTSASKQVEGRRGNVLKDQSGNVIVYNKVTGKLLSAKLWPHVTILTQWLNQNPDCEPVKPGSAHATQLLTSVANKKNATLQQQLPALSTLPHIAKSQPQTGDDLFSNPVKINTGTKEVSILAQTKKHSSVHVQHSGSVRSSNISPKNTTNTNSIKSTPVITKSSSISTSALPIKTSTPKQPEVKKPKRQISEEIKSPPSGGTNSKSRTEHERMNVRTNLKSTLKQRMNEFDHPTIAKMTEDEVEKFAKEIESEMFIFFNKDTREKYKNKFRSLKFNLSDTKNKTLMERICAKKLTPKQLVELPPSALASEELAKWREDESKHQLEIITKAELDALAQNKIVLKTHKGEEVIETKTVPIDISLPDDDVESVIAKTVLSVEDPHGRYDLSRSISLNVSSGHSVSSPLSSPSISSSTGKKSDSHHRSRSRSKSRNRDHHHHKSSSSKHKKIKSERHRSRSPKHHHNSHHIRDKSHGRKSRDKSSEKSRERDRSKKGSDEHKHHRDKSKSNEKERSKSLSRSKDYRESSKESKRHHQKEQQKELKEEVFKEKEKHDNLIQPEQEDMDIVGKILDSMGVHLDPKPKLENQEDEKINTHIDDRKSEVSTLLDQIVPISMEPVNEHSLEIEIYSGNMYMAEVAKFDVTASIVSGNVDDIIKLFTPQLDIVGRIEPKTVWDYLGKVKKLPGKELAVLRFASTDESSYFQLFSYLHTRQRYGVIKSPSPHIKDFYLITIEASRTLPPVLLPIVGPGFIEGEEHKPDLLLGVILKILPETKQHLHKKQAVSKKATKPTRTSVEHNVPIQITTSKHKSHHSHSSINKLTVGLPEVKTTGEVKLSPTKSSRDDDEPYEPLDDDDSFTSSPVFNANSQPSVNKHNASDDLESQMEQLNREIERRQMEIQSLAQQKAMELDEEQASRIYEKITVPHNLSEILSTINASEPKPMNIDDDDDDDEEYVPMAALSNTNSLEYRASSSYQQQTAPIVNSLMDIDERINLFRQQEMPTHNNLPTSTSNSNQQPSRLATMSDADLMKLVPDDALEAPPPPIISSSNSNEPAIPGLFKD